MPLRRIACALCLWLAGCSAAPPPEEARPPEPPPLQSVEQDAPFIVDWDAKQIASLTTALRTPTGGGVVVAYQRNVIRLLPDCHLAGAYVPSGIGMYRGIVQVRRFDSPARSAGTRQDALQQISTSTNVPPGALLESRFVIVGRHYLSGNRPNATVKDLTSRSADGCRDATHFVRAALTGAFEHTGAGGPSVPGAPPATAPATLPRSGDFTPCVMAGNAGTPACSAFLKVELTPLLPAPAAADPRLSPTAPPTPTATAAPPATAPQIVIPKGPTPQVTGTPSAAPPQGTTAPQIAVPKSPAAPAATTTPTGQPSSPPPAQPSSPPAPTPQPPALP